MFIVYVLRCSHGKYYVGRTMDLGIRINQHKSIGTMWTRKHPYMGLLWQKRTNNEDLELSKTLEFMHLLGIDNVRGSIYSRPDLSFKEKLEVCLNFNNKCSRCGRFGHSSNNCRCDICGEYGHLSYQCLNCYKCGGGPDHNFEINVTNAKVLIIIIGIVIIVTNVVEAAISLESVICRIVDVITKFFISKKNLSFVLTRDHME